ncbi:NmrA domain-containing protein [Mycena indigotica]|uniref:NmrA domain-containing protein n=1 Tax=Mycena indigotica TaxID=2126181 RepID=A0A8H6WHC1_9AGAR|nr:NmrA domain-containing protein [Mycena indigotica]KAF7314913.1 NmrA domain-containing protein [Mycena indigotica]
MDLGHPLLIPELIDLFFWHIHTSKQDLAHCALVTRAWTYPAQTHLFRLIRFHDAPDAWTPLLLALADSPHLVQHVRRLHIVVADDTSRSFDDALERIERILHRSNIESITFAYLKKVLTTRSLRALRSLLRLPSLKAVALQCMFPSLGEFAALWSSCSTNIRHLKLVFSVKPHEKEDNSIPRPQRSTIVLESLSSVYSTEDPAMRLLPFDVFKLKTFSALQLRQSEARQLYVSNYASLRELHLGIPDPDPYPRFTAPPAPLPTTQNSPVNLSAMPNLALLGLSFPTIPKTIQTAITIASSISPDINTSLQTIQLTPMRHLYNFMPSPVGMPEVKVLDERLSGLGIGQVLIVAEVGEVWDTWLSELPKVKARNLLHRVDRECDCCRGLSARP